MPPLTRNDQLAILIEKIRQLTCRIQEAEQDERTGDKETEKQVLLRQLRQDRRELRKEFSDIILIKSELDHATETETKRRDDNTARKEKIAKNLGLVELEGKDNQKPTTGPYGLKYTRALNMCEQYRKTINDTATIIDTLLKEETRGMTENATENRRFNVESKIETMKQLGIEYKKYHHELTSMGEAANLEFYISNLKEVMETISRMESKMKFEDEKEKKQLALSKCEQAEK